MKDGRRYKRYNLQANKGADNATLKEMANKNSHQVLAQADINRDDITTSDDDKVANLFGDLEQGIKK